MSKRAFRPRSVRTQPGFSLIELVIVLAVAAILLGLAVPSFRTFMQNSRLAMQANTLVYSLNLARSSAVKLDVPVEVCASSDAATCSGATWANGWIVCYPVVVVAGVNVCGANGGVALTVLQVAPVLGGGNTITEQLGGVLGVTYNSNGQTNPGPGGAAYRFCFSDIRGPTSAQDVEVNPIGRIEASQTQGLTVAGVALAAPC